MKKHVPMCFCLCKTNHAHMCSSMWSPTKTWHIIKLISLQWHRQIHNSAISNNEIYPAWTITLQPPPNLMTNPQQIETTVSLCKTQTKDMLKTLSLMSSDEAKNCKDRADAATQALKAYYQQPVISQYNLDEALNVLD